MYHKVFRCLRRRDTDACLVPALVPAMGIRGDWRGLGGEQNQQVTVRTRALGGFDPAIRRFESFHPSQNCRQVSPVALECGSRPVPRREG
jgi:hypothetical protein